MLLKLPGVLNPEEIASLREVFEKGKLQSGRATAKGSAAEVKNNLQLSTDDPSITEARRIVTEALDRNVIFQAATQPRKITPPRFSRYDEGMGYGEHLDSPLMGRDEPIRLDVSVTLFLTEPDDYDGGELVIDTDHGIQAVKLAAGAGVIYPSTTFHRVETVTRGSRLAAVLWVQSLVADAARRKVLFDLAGAAEYLDRFGEPGRQIEVLRRCHANLLRMWAQP